MKKFLKLLVILSLFAVCLTGCGDTKPEKAKEITLDGSQSFLRIENFSYVVTDKCVLLIEKDAEIRQDYAEMLDAMIDKMEDQLGLSYAPDGFKTEKIDIYSGSVGFDPFADVDLGDKIVVYYTNDRDGYKVSNAEEGTPSIACKSSQTRVYGAVAREIAISIVSRHVTLSSIMAKGCVEAFADKAYKSLINSHPEWNGGGDVTLNDMTNPITADTAEELFKTDCNYNDTMDQRTYGYMFGSYLYANVGKNSLADYISLVMQKGIVPSTGMPSSDPSAMKGYTDCAKEVFGNNVFVDFGNWVPNNIQYFDFF